MTVTHAACRVYHSMLPRSTLLVLVAAAVFGSAHARAAESTPRVVHIGFVLPQSPSPSARGVLAFWGRMRELGWVEGQNLVIEERWGNGRTDRLPALMADVIAHKVDVLVTSGTLAAVAAKGATS
jgi:putative tryptophan/tyrosine transport system substrate-binding protein